MASLFKKIGKVAKKVGKGYVGVIKTYGKVVGKVAKGAAKLAQNPLVSAGLGLAAGIALPGVGGALMKGATTAISKVGNKLKGLKMSSAVDKVLDQVDPGTKEKGKGIFGLFKKAKKTYEDVKNGMQSSDDDYPGTDSDGDGTPAANPSGGDTVTLPEDPAGNGGETVVAGGQDAPAPDRPPRSGPGPKPKDKEGGGGGLMLALLGLGLFGMAKS